MTPRSQSWMAPLTISLADAEFPSIMTTRLPSSKSPVFLALWFLLLFQFMGVAVHLAIAQGEFLPIGVLLFMGAFGASFSWWGMRVCFTRCTVHGEEIIREILAPLCSDAS